MKIASVKAREILDSRGNPTVEVDITLEDGSNGRAAVPSGASTGIHEALELRDKDEERYGGEGVLKAVGNVNGEIAAEIVGQEFGDIKALDDKLIALDGTPNKSRLGANAILGVSIAFTQAMAESQHLPTFKYIASIYGAEPKMPRPMFNVMNGGRHANWATDIQEFMVIPLNQEKFSESLRIGTEIFHALEEVLKEKGYDTDVGNEGGYAPEVKSNTEALDLIVAAIAKAGYRPGEEVALGMDIAASEFFLENAPTDADDQYELKKEARKLNTAEWVNQISEWIHKYPLISIEDPFSQDEWVSWEEFLKDEGNSLKQVVGDDLLVTNVERIKKAIEMKACNALLVKLNQIGTVSETLAAMKLAESAGWFNIVSHRSGETEDTFIAHLATGTGAGQIKSGAPSRGERTAKYNELLRIEELL
jgi:enolase